MMRCSKCGVEKDESNYQKYFHSTQQKWRVRRECTECLYNTRLKKKNPELYYQNHPDYHKCIDCKEWKLNQEFYTRPDGRVYLNRCRECEKTFERNKRIEHLKENGGSEKINMRPNQYMDIYQKEQTFLVMEILGYSFNEESGIWTKPGVKEIIDGKIVFPKLKKRKHLGRYDSKVNYETLQHIIELREKGMGFNDIGVELGISDTTAFNHYRRWKNISK